MRRSAGVKLCDFGLCATMDPDGAPFTDFVGSPGFFARAARKDTPRRSTAFYFPEKNVISRTAGRARRGVRGRCEKEPGEREAGSASGAGAHHGVVARRRGGGPVLARGRHGGDAPGPRGLRAGLVPGVVRREHEGQGGLLLRRRRGPGPCQGRRRGAVLRARPPPPRRPPPCVESQPIQDTFNVGVPERIFGSSLSPVVENSRTVQESWETSSI